MLVTLKVVSEIYSVALPTEHPTYFAESILAIWKLTDYLKWVGLHKYMNRHTQT